MKNKKLNINFRTLFIIIVTFLMIIISAFNLSIANEVKITFWHTFSDNSSKGKVINKLISDFNNSNILVNGNKVIVESVYKGSKDRYSNPYITLFNELIKAGAKNELPDISLAYENWVSQFEQVKLIDDLTPLIQEDQQLKDYIENLFPVFKQAIYINNKILSIPYNKSIYVFYYNKKYINDLDLRDFNFDEFVKYLENIKSKINKPPLYLEPNEDTFIIMYLLIYKKDFFKIENNEVEPFFLPEEVKNVINTLKKLESQGLIKFTGNSVKDFLNNEAPIILSTSSRYVDFVNNRNNIGISSLPAKEGYIHVAGTNLAIFSKDPIKTKASIEFIKFLLKEPNLTYMVINTGYVPTTDKLKNYQEYKNYLEMNPEYQKVLDYSMDKLYIQPQIWAWENFRWYLNETMFNTISNNSDLNEESLKFYSKVIQIISNQNLVKDYIK